MRRLLVPVLGVGLLTATAVLLHRTFRHLSWAQLGADLMALGPTTVLSALTATAVSYLAMTGYDALALRHIGHRLPYRRYGLASFIATSFGNNLGASALVGAALRARIYSSWQVPANVTARIVGFNAFTLALGAAVLAGVGVLHEPALAGRALRLPPTVALVIGCLLLTSVVGFLAWALCGPRAAREAAREAGGGAARGVGGGAIRTASRARWGVRPPSPRVAVAQVGLSTLEWLAMAAVLHLLLPAGERAPFLTFAVAFAVATLAGLVSGVPGGLGVFETALVVLLGPSTSPAALATALVAYRLCYFVLPLLLAAILLVAHEARRGTTQHVAAREAAERVTSPITSPITSPVTRGVSGRVVGLIPTGLALGMAAAGVFMLVNGDLPGPGALEVSAVTTGLAGLAGLLTARGLHRRLASAWAATLALMVSLTAVAAAYGDLPLAIVIAGLGVLILPARSVFFRGGALLTRLRDPLAPLTAAALVGAAVCWHEFGASNDAPLLVAAVSGDTAGVDRIAIVVGAVGVFIGARRILAPAVLGPPVPCEVEMARVSGVVARFGRCTAHLAFTGDKRFHFSPGGTSFLMYQVEGRSWVVMGDPVGDSLGDLGDVRDLVMSFVAEVDRHGGRPVFYNVLTNHADLYRECGLSLAKLGEEAVVQLQDFTLTGKTRVNLRNCRNKSQRLGHSVEFIPAQDVAPLLPALREVSEAWLAHRNGKEKRFSLGAFDEDYVTRFPLAVVRQEEKIVAFATLWIDGERQEVQVDLMRRLPHGPNTVMTFLFVECILWAKENGFSSFSLGVAPLAGLGTTARPLLWDRIGHLLWTHGERFYNFKGLRAFKQGFQPSWRIRYVAAPGGLALPRAMVDVATLVGGGVRGVVRS